MARTPVTRGKIPGWPIVVALAVLCLYLYYVRIVLLPFVLAGAAAFLLTPLVDRLHRRIAWLPRWIAAVAIYLVVLGALGAAGYWLAPPVIADFAALARQAPDLLRRFAAFIAPQGKLVLLGQPIDDATLVQSALGAARSFFLSGAGISVAAGGIAVVFGGFLTLVLLAYFLISGATLGRGLLWLVPPEYRSEMHRLTANVAPMLRRYFLGLVIVVCYTATTAWLVLTEIFRVDHAPLLAVTVGLLELVPVIGPMTSLTLIILASTQQATFVMMAGLIAFGVMLRLSIDQVISPVVLGRAAYLHPVAIIFAFLSGAVFLGVLGLLLAVPVAATIKIVLSHYYAEKLAASS